MLPALSPIADFAQLVRRSFERSQKLPGLDQKQLHLQPNLSSSSTLLGAASSERSKDSATQAASASAPSAPVANGKPVTAVQQATQPDEPLHSSADIQQVHATPLAESHPQSLQPIPVVEAASMPLPIAETGPEVEDGRAASLASVHLQDAASALMGQPPQPDTQMDKQLNHSVKAQRLAAVDLHPRSGLLASAPREHQQATATSTADRRHAQELQYGPAAPSGSRPASQQHQQQQQQPRKRRQFHDEPLHLSGPDSGRRRSQTPDVEFGRDGKRSRHTLQPAPAHARYAEHATHAEHARHAEHPRPSPGPPRSMSISPLHGSSRDLGPGHPQSTVPAPYAAAHGRKWDADRLRSSRPAGFDNRQQGNRQQDHRKGSWSRAEHREGAAAPRHNNHHRNHDSRFDRRSSSTDRTIRGESNSCSVLLNMKWFPITQLHSIGLSKQHCVHEPHLQPMTWQQLVHHELVRL